MTRVLRNIGQLATCPNANEQSDAGLVNDAALVIEEGKIQWSGPEADLPPQFQDAQSVDCHKNLVIPGLIDCHTHLCFGGWRGDEFEMRLQGKTYQEIAHAGGGIRRTVYATRESPTSELISKAKKALDSMLSLGVTTVECKSGYGLDYDNELRQLEIYKTLNFDHPIDLIPTFLGAHVIPPEFTGNRGDYVDLVCDEMLPAIAERKLAKFCDAFVEQGAFTIKEGYRILETARSLGLGLKVHADQLNDTGSARLAAELGAVSAEHLEYANPDGMAAMGRAGTVAVSLPLASLYLGEAYMPARQFMASGVQVAIASDFNPGSAPSYHLPLAMTLGCLNQAMTPQEVLMGATTIAARAISVQSSIGSLLPGYQADIAVMDAPNLNQWLYHFQGNACTAVYKNGINQQVRQTG